MSVFYIIELTVRCPTHELLVHYLMMQNESRRKKGELEKKIWRQDADACEMKIRERVDGEFGIPGAGKTRSREQSGVAPIFRRYIFTPTPPCQHADMNTKQPSLG